MLKKTAWQSKQKQKLNQQTNATTKQLTWQGQPEVRQINKKQKTIKQYIDENATTKQLT